MFSPFEDAEVEDYFNRLNAQLRKMPPEDRHEMHLELRQHLDALVAAHEELGASPEEAVRAALNQLGEPKRIGRRLFQEWRKTQPPRLDPLLAAFLCASGLLSAGWAWSFSLLPSAGSLACVVAGAVLDYGAPLIAGAVTGLLLPRRALLGTTLAVSSVLAVIGLVLGFFDIWVHSFADLECWMGRFAPWWLTLGAVSAWAVGRLRQRLLPRASPA